MFSREKTAQKRLEELDIDFLINDNIGSNNPIHYTKILKQIHGIVSDKNINILHSYSRATEFLCTLYKKYINKNIKTVNTVMSLVSRKFFVEYKSDRIISISRCVNTELTDKFKIPKGRIKLIYNFAEPPIKEYISIKRKESGFVILSAGRFHEEKNFKTLLRALHFINNPQISLKLVGSGKLEADYKKYILKHNIKAAIFPSQNDLAPLFAQCDICVLPSVVDPLPTFMIQAGLFKKPFIGSDVDGIGETIEHEVNGLTFEKKNYKELADNIMRFYEDKKLMIKCSDNLFSLVSERHSPDKNIDQIYNLYIELLSK
ncbi:MAG: glycosyltransferase family 4 protein [Ignavibacteria bacterium]